MSWLVMIVDLVANDVLVSVVSEEVVAGDWLGKQLSW